MVVVMTTHASDDEVAGVVRTVRHAGVEAFVSQGRERTVIGLVGDVDAIRALNLRRMPGVADVIRVSTRYKLVSLDHHPGRSTVHIGHGPNAATIGPDTFTLIAGPCAVESLDQMLEAAAMAKSAGAALLRGSAFRPRAAPSEFQGLGRAGLHILAEARAATGLPVVTEVVDPADVAVVAEHADMVQVGARNMQNYALLDAVAAAGRPILLKRSIHATVEEWLLSAEYLAQRGTIDIVLCERGIRTFEPSTRATPDLSAVPLVQTLAHLPVIVDPSHATGRRDLVLPISRAAIAVGADGLLVDIHPDPESALSHGSQALAGAEVRELASVTRRLPPFLGRTSA